MTAFLNRFTACFGLSSERLNSKSLGDCAIRISYLIGLNQRYLVIQFQDYARLLVFGVMIFSGHRVQHCQVVVP